MAFFSRLRKPAASAPGLMDAPVTPQELAAHGFLPPERLNPDRPMPDPELDHIVAAAQAGDWRPGADFLVATGSYWERRTAAIDNLAGVAAKDDSWLLAWESARPDDPDAAAVEAASMIKLAWSIRGGARAHMTTGEQFEGFLNVLGRSGETIERAKALNPADPSAYVTDIWLGVGQGRPHEEMHHLWSQLTARDPYHYEAHRSALQYWCAKWRGSRELAFDFAERAAAGAPPGTLLSALRLTARWEHRPRDGTRMDYGTLELRAAVDATLNDVAAAPSHHPYLADVRHMLAYFLVVQDRPGLALEQFRHVDGYVGAFPWVNGGTAVETYCDIRDLAIRHARSR
ncbi:hypothetical protein ACIHCQ_04975 [Streptomyces sp. NPDC052236]|uniref:hypothetical protein n=1 Tax=Streptomyces sp. NPDC052236 TaxID=3365686 RepID=UPI0037D8B8F4